MSFVVRIFSITTCHIPCTCARRANAPRTQWDPAPASLVDWKYELDPDGHWIKRCHGKCASKRDGGTRLQCPGKGFRFRLSQIT